MPVINIKMLKGRTKDQKRQLITRLTIDICNICRCEPKAVTIIIEDVPKENWGTAGIQK